jgi:stress-induced-phosphoprotein 1
MRQKAEEDRQKKEAEAAAARKAAEEAAMPSEKKEALKRAKEAEDMKAKGNEHYKKKEFEEALKFYNIAKDMNPDEVIYWSNIGACHIEMKQFEKAVEACDQGIASTKGKNYDFVKLAKVMARKASALDKMGNPEEALKVYS